MAAKAVHANITLGQKAETYSCEKQRVMESMLRKAESGAVNLPGPQKMQNINKALGLNVVEKVF
jgi:hypothetical protein